MYLKNHIFDGTLLVAICDRELIGQTFSDGRLTLEVSEFFYKGALSSAHEVMAALGTAVVANLAGKRAIECALEGGFITEDNILIIDGVPHAQMAMDADQAVRM